MDRRSFLKTAGSAALLAITSHARAAEPAGRKPNIILCMSDDQGWGQVSYNEKGALAQGKCRTVQLDEMAAASLRFDRFYSSSSVCSPTRASCMTGRHPYRYGVTLYGKPLKLEEKTIAQALLAAGYATGHFGKWHLDGISGAGKPIKKEDPLSPGAFGFQAWFSVTNFFDANCTFSCGGTPVATKGDGSDVIVDEALKWIDGLEKQEAGKPFFAVVWFGSPHVPHKPLPDDLRAAGGNAELGEVIGLDRAMGTLRKGLRQRGLAGNTMLWFNSDNGRPGDNGILSGGKGSLSEGGIRVPGLCEWPGRVKPGRTSVPVVTSDFYPTILEAAGVAVPEDKPMPLDGISLMPLLEGKISERPSPIGFMEQGAMALSDNRYKLIVKGSVTTLYDLLEDPGETKDLSGAKPDVIAKMKPVLDAWAESVRKSQSGVDYRK